MTQMHDAHSPQSIRQTFGFESGDAYGEWLQQQNQQPSGIPAGKELVDALLTHAMQDKHIDDKQERSIREVFAASMPADPTTGGLGKEWNEFFLDSYKRVAADSALKPVHIVELDFSNMGGANSAIGREPVNRSVAIMSEIYKNELEDAGAKLTTIRTGGDELRFYTQGIGQEAIDKAITRAQDSIAHFTAELGTDALEHTKYKNNPLRSGFGVGAGSAALTDAHASAESLQEALDKQIEAHKVDIGAKRQLPANALKTADALRKSLPREHVQEVLAAWEEKLSLDKQARREATPELLTLQGQHENTYKAREEKALDASQTWSKPAQDLLLSGVDLFNSYDPTSGLKSPKALFADLPYQQQAAAQGDAQPIITLFEITNLRGLNKHRNHEEANKVIHNIVGQFTGELSERLPETDMHERLYSLGASRFALVTTQTPPDELNDAIQHAARNRDHVIKITADLERLKNPEAPALTEIDNPTKSVVAMTGDVSHEKGLMITHVSMPIDASKHLTPKMQLQILEDLSDVYGFRPEAANTSSQDALNAVKRGEVSLATGNETSWWVGNSETPAVEAKGIPHEIASHATAGVRIPRESLPRIVAELESHDRKPSNSIIVENAALRGTTNEHAAHKGRQP